ncbi:MAG: hypothetical protein KAI25_13570, partial [Hyphomicrobiaceae bacterium]|nr:hypothetical protein [Hyphomicrobiaceae bacterium]
PRRVFDPIDYPRPFAQVRSTLDPLNRQISAAWRKSSDCNPGKIGGKHTCRTISGGATKVAEQPNDCSA